jgi:hypothetical protein
VDGAATGLIAIVLNRDGGGPRILVGSPGNGLAFDVRPQILPLEVAQLIMRVEILSGQSRTALEANHFHSGFAELGRKNAASGTNPDDDDISLFDCHDSPLG